jgi:hypothetical protein
MICKTSNWSPELRQIEICRRHFARASQSRKPEISAENAQFLKPTQNTSAARVGCAAARPPDATHNPQRGSRLTASITAAIRRISQMDGAKIYNRISIRLTAALLLKK